jgi:hypothetical protein
MANRKAARLPGRTRRMSVFTQAGRALQRSRFVDSVRGDQPRPLTPLSGRGMALSGRTHGDPPFMCGSPCAF